MARQQLSSAEECGEGLMVGARRADLSVLPMADQQGFLHCHTAPLETVAKKESIQSAGAVDVRGSEEEQYVKRLQPASAVMASLNKQPPALKQWMLASHLIRHQQGVMEGSSRCIYSP